MPRLSNRYCGIAWYFSNARCHSDCESGGSVPVTGCHSTIESPDSVTRVAPPTSTMTKISPATASSQIRTMRRCRVSEIGSMEIARNVAAEAAAKLAKLCPPNNAPPAPRARRIAAAPAPPHGSAHRLPFRLPPSRERPSLGQAYGHGRREAARIEASPGISRQLVRDAALGEFGAEALLARGVRGGAAALLPFQHEALGVLLTIRIPAHLHVSAGVGERAVFRRIGRQLVKDHAEHDRGARGNEELAARDQHRLLLSLLPLQHPHPGPRPVPAAP